jgi:cell division protein FtsI (penicillin-binding protein 3)
MDRAKIRFRIFAVTASLALFGIALRITHLTFWTGGARRSAAPSLIRGPIVDRRGLFLAVTEEASTIAIAPHEIVDAEFTAEALAERLGMEPTEIFEKINRYRDRRYFLLRRQVDNFTADTIVDLNLPGVHRESEFSRRYPGETLASNLIGFVGRDQENALAGVERTYQEVLMTPTQKESHNGGTLQLSIDSLMQYRLEEAMGEAFLESKSKRAVGIFMDIQTGEILAIANFPNFNPNRYYSSRPSDRGNWALRLNYEPGSTIKVIMAAILLSENAVNAREKFHCDGEIRYKDIAVRCKNNNRPVSHGDLTLDEIIKYSCNVGIIKAMQRVRNDRLYYYLTRLGFGQRTNVMNGVGETAGYLPDLKNWYAASRYYMPIGQSFSVTPLQLLRATASIANGGTLHRPVLAMRILNESGQTLDEASRPITENPFTPDVNRRVLEMMRGVVTGGTGRLADLREMKIAGKTGTGQKSSAEGYTDQYISSFLGFFPEEKPRYGGLILFDEPGELGGGAIAAPVFARFVRSILPLLSSGPASQSVGELKSIPVTHPEVDHNRMYDFHGLSAKEALSIIAKRYGIKARLNGSGYVYKQSPKPGARMKGVDTIELYLDFM